MSNEYQPMGPSANGGQEPYPYAGQQEPYTPQQEPYAPQQEPYTPQQEAYAGQQVSYGQPYTQPAGGYAYPQAGYGQPVAQGVYGPVPPQEKWNVLCIIGFVLAFLLPPVGLILSIIAIVQINRSGEKSKGMAIAGTVVGGVCTVLGILAVVFVFLFAGWALDHADEFAETSMCVNGRCEFCIDGDCYTFSERDGYGAAWETAGAAAAGTVATSAAVL